MCDVNFRYFEEVVPDNENVYYSYLIGIIESVDELSSVEITNNINGPHIRIAPSLPKYSNLLLEEIIKLHNVFHIHLDLSKSIKSSGGTISFEIIMK